jgi:hypothetical protein
MKKPSSSGSGKLLKNSTRFLLTDLLTCTSRGTAHTNPDENLAAMDIDKLAVPGFPAPTLPILESDIPKTACLLPGAESEVTRSAFAPASSPLPKWLGLYPQLECL